MSKKKSDKKKASTLPRENSRPPYDGFFTSSIASANESTGHAVTVPLTNEGAREVGVLGSNANSTSKKGKRGKQKI